MANFFKRDERDALEDAKNAWTPRAVEKAKEDRLQQLANLGQINLKEAAIVFSQDGFNLFVNMLCNSVDRVIEERVAQIIDLKMMEVMEGMKIGMEKSMESMGDQVLQRFGLAPKQEEKQIQFDLGTSEVTEVSKEEVSATVEVEPEPVEVEPEPEIVTVAGNLPDTPPSFELSNEGKEIVDKLNNMLDRQQADNSVKLEIVKPNPRSLRRIGAKKVELEHWAPMFADYLIERPNRKIPLYEITQYLEQEHYVKFINPTHVTNVMLELYATISKPEKGFYMYKPAR